MSSDNGIYLLKTPIELDRQLERNKEASVSGFKQEWEFRVSHCQAIDNIYWDEDAPDNHNPEGDPEQVVSYFGDCDVLTEEEAQKKAFELEKEILSDDFYPILEYGISTITLSRSFQWYQQKEAKKKLKRNDQRTTT